MPQLLLSLKHGSLLREGALVCPPLTLPLDSAVLGVAQALLSGKHSLTALMRVAASTGPLTPLELLRQLQIWREHGLLCHTIPLADTPRGREPASCGELASIIPLTPEFALALTEAEPTQRHVLSRFACMRRLDDELVIESPLGHARVVLHDQRASAIVHTLACGATIEQLTETHGDVPASSLALFVSVLGSAGMLARPQEDADALRQWAFHDLFFHSRSRRGRHADPHGKTEPFRERIPPLPALKPNMSRTKIALPAPDMDEVARRDPSLDAVMRARRSRRSFGATPITLTQLGEFLHRAARSEAPGPDAMPRSHESDVRPYPSGGGCHELELYVVVNACSGLASGVYHHQPMQHALYELGPLGDHARSLLAESGRAMASDVEPQVLLIFAARFQRVSWAYESMAYALVLKHVGVLMQTMYLVATSMGLAACALGSGNADTFAELTGLDYFVEGSVGEFVLGSC